MRLGVFLLRPPPPRMSCHCAVGLPSPHIMFHRCPFMHQGEERNNGNNVPKTTTQSSRREIMLDPDSRAIRALTILPLCLPSLYLQQPHHLCLYCQDYLIFSLYALNHFLHQYLTNYMQQLGSQFLLRTQKASASATPCPGVLTGWWREFVIEYSGDAHVWHCLVAELNS